MASREGVQKNVELYDHPSPNGEVSRNGSVDSIVHHMIDGAWTLELEVPTA